MAKADGDSYVGGEGDMNDGLLSFTGYVRIDNPGEVDIRSESDDGSVIWIAGTKVVDNDGGHGAPGPSPDGSYNFESPGLYPIEIAWYNGNWTNDAGDHGGANLKVLAGGAKSPVTFYTVHLMWPQSPLLLHLPQLRLGMLVCMLPTGRPGQKV